MDVFLKRRGGHGQRFRRETPLRSFFELWGKIDWEGRKDKTGAYDALLGSLNMREVSQCCTVRHFGRGWMALISPEKSRSVGISNTHRPPLRDAHI